MGSRISRGLVLVAAVSVLSSSALAASVAPTAADTQGDASRFAARVWHELTGAPQPAAKSMPNGSPGASGIRNVVAEPPPRTLAEPSSVAFVAGAFGVLAFITRRRKH